MKLYNWLHDRSDLFGTISYPNLSLNQLFINHPLPDLPNLLGQPSKSTFSLI